MYEESVKKNPTSTIGLLPVSLNTYPTEKITIGVIKRRGRNLSFLNLPKKSKREKE